MNPIISVIDKDCNISNFYPDGSFDGINSQVSVVNSFSLKIRQVQAAITEHIKQGKALQDFQGWFMRTMGVVSSSGASHETEPYFDNIPPQNGMISGEK